MYMFKTFLCGRRFELTVPPGVDKQKRDLRVLKESIREDNTGFNYTTMK